MDRIKVLQIGNTEIDKLIKGLGSEVILEKCSSDSDIEEVLAEAEREYDVTIMEYCPNSKCIEGLRKVIKTYTLFVINGISLSEDCINMILSKKGRYIDYNVLSAFLQRDLKYYFPTSYGEKYEPNNLSVSDGFTGTIKWNGKCSVDLEGEYGDEYVQVAFWRNNIPIEKNQCIDLWLEYDKTEDVHIELRVVQFKAGSLSEIQKAWKFNEEKLKNVAQIENDSEDGRFFASILAKGKGHLSIIALHDRYSRRGHGTFLPGGDRYVTSEREEFFCYFDPMDFKPPLNVYFSGYKTKEGFEGHNLLKKMGHPYLLVSEARVEGGGFYLGSKEYETMIVGAIRKYIDELGFCSDQVIFSGISMGTFGALYYGCDFSPHAMILGKPLVNLGDIACNERLLRPGGFPTSLDVLLKIRGRADCEAAEELNQKFWRKFDNADFHNSKFVVAYMYEDDYDTKAYSMLISHLGTGNVRVYGKGLHGRHNDNTGGIVNWFVSQFGKTIEEDFG